MPKGHPCHDFFLPVSKKPIHIPYYQSQIRNSISLVFTSSRCSKEYQHKLFLSGFPTGLSQTLVLMDSIKIPKRQYRGLLTDRDQSNVQFEHYILSCGHARKDNSIESANSFHYQIILNENTLQLPRIPHQQIGGNHFFNCPLGHITHKPYSMSPQFRLFIQSSRSFTL